MSTPSNVSLHLPPETLARLDARVAATRRIPGCRNVSRASLVCDIVAEAVAGQAISADCAPAPVVATHGAPSTDAERLLAAMTTAGCVGDAAAARGVGAIDKSTIRAVRLGSLPLATAGGGRVLAWVESVERGAP